MRRFPDPNTPVFMEARDELFRAWLVEVANQTQAQYDDQQARTTDLEARLDEREADLVTQRVHANYARAADAESDDERRRMLAFADAALIDTTITLAQHSRAQRIIRELDPSDALWLNVLNKVTGVRRGKEVLRHEDHLRWIVWSESPAADILSGSGCVRLSHDSGGFGGASWDGAVVTREGRLVLNVLRLYVRARPAPIEVPGRETRPDDVTEAEAWVRLGRIPSLRGDVARLATGRLAMYDASKPNANLDGPTPAHNAKATLRIFQVPISDAEAVASRAPLELGQWLNPGMPVDDVRIDAPESGGDSETRTLQIHGPHDVVRWLADEIDARWV